MLLIIPCLLLSLFSGFSLQFHHVVDLLRAVAQETLEVADKPIHVAFARCLQNDVLVIVIPAKDNKGRVVEIYVLQALATIYNSQASLASKVIETLCP